MNGERGSKMKQPYKKPDSTHHRLGPDEMQPRSANAIGDAAAGENKAETVC